ncbi:MAG: pilus assembly protein TadG-related protein [Acidimicrobiales bacterium]
MTQTDCTRPRQRGQILALAGVTFILMIAMAGLVIDGGFAYVQRRGAQNASDFAAVAGTRIVMANALSSGAYTGTDVKTAMEAVLTANGIASSDYSANYVDSSGNLIAGSPVVAGGSIPSAARGVQVSASRTSRTFFAGIAGINTMTATAKATARGGFGPGGSALAGDLIPIAVDFTGVSGLVPCPPGKPSNDPSCSGSFLDLGTGTGPGQFGWMAWPGFSQNAPDLCTMLTPPLPSPTYTIAPDSYVGISGNTGKSNSSCVRNAIAALAASSATYLVPILSPGTGNYPGTSIPYPPSCGPCNGSKAVLNVIGFAGFQITGCLHNPCIGAIQGVLRKIFFLGPTGGSGSVSDPGSTVAIELVQ